MYHFFSEHCVMVKVKCVLPMRRGAHLPSLGCEFVVGQTTDVCNQWPVQCQLYGYLSNHRASLSCDRCQFMVAEAYVCEQLAQDCYLSNRTANSRWQKIQVDLSMTLTCDRHFQSSASYGHDPYTHE